MSEALRRTYELMKEFKRDSASKGDTYPHLGSCLYPAFEEKLKKADIKQGDYVVSYVDEFVNFDMPSTINIFTHKNSNPQEKKEVEKNREKIREIAKSFGLVLTTESPLTHILILANRRGRNVVKMKNNYIAVDPTYKKAGEILEELGEKMFGARIK